MNNTDYRLKYMKYKMKYKTGGADMNLSNIINNSIKFHESAVGKDNGDKTLTMKQVDDNFKYKVPYQNRPMYAILKSLCVDMDTQMETDPVFLGLKTDIYNCKFEYVLDFNTCEYFKQQYYTNQIKISKECIQHLMRTTKYYYNKEYKNYICKELKLFLDWQLSGDYEKIYLKNATRTLILNKFNKSYNDSILIGVIHNVIRKLNSISTMEMQHNNIYNIKILYQLLFQNGYNDDFIQNKLSIINSKLSTNNDTLIFPYEDIITGLQQCLNFAKVAFERLLSANYNYTQLCTDTQTIYGHKYNCLKTDKKTKTITEFSNDMYDLIKYAKTGISIAKELQRPHMFNNVDYSLDMLAPRVCSIQKVFPIVKSVKINGKIYYNIISSGEISIKNGNILFTENNNKQSITRHPIWLANISGVDLSTNYKASVAYSAFKAKYDKSIEDMYNIISNVINEKEIKHFCYIPIGIGAFISGFTDTAKQKEDKKRILKTYATNFVNYITDMSINIYITLAPGYNIWYFLNEIIRSTRHQINTSQSITNIPRSNTTYMSQTYLLESMNDFNNYKTYIDGMDENMFHEVKINKATIIFHKKDNFSVATNLSYHSDKVMMLNPSDCISTLMWEYGYYWNGVTDDYIVGEEVLANQTTMAFLYPIVMRKFGLKYDVDKNEVKEIKMN